MIRILLDECLHIKLQYRFREVNRRFQVSTVIEKNWNGTKNGNLLTLAQDEFDVFITNDQNLPHQQNISKFDIAIIVLNSKSNRYEDLLNFVEPTAEIIPSAQKGILYTVSAI